MTRVLGGLGRRGPARVALRHPRGCTGLIATGAADGAAALAAVRARGVDTMVLDMDMPGLSGVEVLEALDPGVPIVVVYSAFEYVDQRILVETYGERICSILRKPTPSRELVLRMTECTGAGT